MLVPEYDLNNPITWNVIRERDVISESEDRWFHDELVRIAGWNPHHEPNLIRRWAATYNDPMKTDGGLKYFLANSPSVLKGFEYIEDGKTIRVDGLAQVPAHVLIPVPKYDQHELGQRRHVIEVWRSPAFLEQSGRYVEDVRRDPESGEVLLREFPRRGAYDCFFIIETRDGLYHKADSEALVGIRLKWEQEKKSRYQQELEHQKAMNVLAKENRQRVNEIWSPDSMLLT